MNNLILVILIFVLIFFIFVLISGIVNQIESAIKRLIDHYFTRRQEHIDKMLKDELAKAKLQSFN